MNEATGIFHLATLDEWAAAQAGGSVTPPSLATEGFVHCSRHDQVDGTIQRHYTGVDELVLLRLDETSLSDALVWEDSRPGERYPHVYRAIALHEVVEVIPWRRGVGTS